FDGAAAFAEAALMAVRVFRGRRKKVIVSPMTHPEYRQTLRTYTMVMDLNITGDEDPINELDDLKSLLDENTACLIVQNPDFIGQLSSPKELKDLADAVHRVRALFVVAIDPISLGLFVPPGEYGADIVTGEGQSLGNAISFGGPYLGIFATRMKYVHHVPGRLFGETVDTEGRRGYVMTLSAREQHIRREKATSNICTNEGLCALAAGAYLAAMGKTGLRQVAELCYHKAHYAAQQIAAIPGFELISGEPFFKEFAVRCPKPPAEINKKLLDYKIVGGYDLGKVYPHLKDCMLLCMTEMNTKEEIDRLVGVLKEVAS
ncbi:MAG: aminomethyl-transferring glycine dehydrogenase subunit GcvPA, partial [Chloroflexota bacterium]|nr:aminomethyl-transferring glycine dehydrogenase subunit GcvPA [Chloroflexota bacterium]